MHYLSNIINAFSGKGKNQTLPVQSRLLLYQTEDGQTRIRVRLENETVWLTQHKAMYMKEWITKLDEFLKVSERDILSHAG